MSDVGLGVLLSFVAIFVLILGRVFHLELLKDLATKLPKSVYLARKLLQRNCDKFLKLVCCPKCSTLYSYDKCITTDRNGVKYSKRCDFIQFPCHSQPARRSSCGAVLMKEVRTASGTTYLYPKQLYCYTSIIEVLRKRMTSSCFISKCEEWRNKTLREGEYNDIFDGQVWKDFLYYDGIPFLSLPYNIAFCLNVDWFQPFSIAVGQYTFQYLIFLALKGILHKMLFC